MCHVHTRTWRTCNIAVIINTALLSIFSTAVNLPSVSNMSQGQRSVVLGVDLQYVDTMRVLIAVRAVCLIWTTLYWSLVPPWSPASPSGD